MVVVVVRVVVVVGIVVVGIVVVVVIVVVVQCVLIAYSSRLDSRLSQSIISIRHYLSDTYNTV